MVYSDNTVGGGETGKISVKMEKQRREAEAEAEAVVIGGMVLDIQATSSIPPHPRTTCPGKVSFFISLSFPFLFLGSLNLK